MLMNVMSSELDSRAQPRLRGGGGVVQLRVRDERDPVSRENLMHRVRAEFREMPGLRLTFAQAQRLFGLREDVCHRILMALSAEGLLWKAPDDRFGVRSAS